MLEAVAGDALQDDPSAHYYVPGVPLAKRELVARGPRARPAQRLGGVRALAGGREDPASKAGLASLLKTIWGKDYDDERDARFINDRVHANIQKDGTFSVVPRIFGGVTTAAELRRIADVAEKYDVPMVKITGGQRIDLLGDPRRRSCPTCGATSGCRRGTPTRRRSAPARRASAREFCRYGVGDSTALGIAIEKRFQGLESPAKVKLATAGCPRNCSEATTKDVGAVAIEGGRWEIYVGGAAGAHVRKGDILAVVDTHDEVLRYMGRFMQYYREHAKYLERTYDFVPRVGHRAAARRARGRRRGDRRAARRRRSRPRSTRTSIRGRRRSSRCIRRSSPDRCRWRRGGRGDAMSAVRRRPRRPPVNLGSIDRIPPGRGRPSSSTARDRRVPLARTRCGRRRRAARTGPLADGIVGDGKVICPLHSYRFDLATGCPEGNACASLTTYPAGLTAGGDVVVTLGGR